MKSDPNPLFHWENKSVCTILLHSLSQKTLTAETPIYKTLAPEKCSFKLINQSVQPEKKTMGFKWINTSPIALRKTMNPSINLVKVWASFKNPACFVIWRLILLNLIFFLLLSNHYIFLVKTIGERILSECLKSNLAEVFEICLFIIKKKRMFKCWHQFFLNKGVWWGVETIKIDKNIEVVICCTAFYKKKYLKNYNWPKSKSLLVQHFFNILI